MLKGVRIRLDRAGRQFCVFTVIIGVLVTHKNQSQNPVMGCVLTQNNQAYKIET